MISVAFLWCCLFLHPGVSHAWLSQDPRPHVRQSYPRLFSSTTEEVQNNNTPLAAEVQGVPYDKELVYMGISQEFDELPKGSSITRQFTHAIGPKDTENTATNNRQVTVKKLSQRPPIFLLKGILTPDECHQIQSLASRQKLTQAETRQGGDDNRYRHKSQYTWIPNHSAPGDELHLEGLEKLSQELHSMFLPFEPCCHPTSSTEDLQVVHYDTSGFYNLHHDGTMRIVTVLYYLNGVADTWFPLADYKGGRLMQRMDALAAASELSPETDGVRIRDVKPGDAILFYNYFQDASMEWNAIHAGLPASSDKWIATHWYHHVQASQCPSSSPAQ